MKSKKPPKLAFRNAEPMQDYYSDGEGNHFSVARLLDDSKDIEVFDCPVAAIDLSSEIWSGCDMFDLAFHLKKCMDADLSFPILLDWRGRIADGRHRVLKAIATGERTVKARRMWWKPTPDRQDSGAK